MSMSTTIILKLSFGDKRSEFLVYMYVNPLQHCYLATSIVNPKQKWHLRDKFPIFLNMAMA